MTRLVTVTYEDKTSIYDNEIIEQAKLIHGSNAEVEIKPSNPTPASYIYYGISQLISEEQTNIFFDQHEQYEIKLLTLKKDIDKQIKYILNKVIMDNENKFLL